MIKDKERASHLLLGRKLPNGWEVTKKYEKSAFGSGGVYSCCYEVRRTEDGVAEIGFLKAIDFSDAMRASSESPTKIIQNITNAFEYEKKLLSICYSKGLNNIVRLVDQGGVDIDEAKAYPRVEYLILEHADEGDVRNVIKNNENLNFEWKIRSVHQVAKGLAQLHSIGIAHQDVKPANVVNFGKDNTKLTDLGSACSKDKIQDLEPEHLDERYSGTFVYSPPELLYGYVNSNWDKRRISCDLYLLGSLIIFYFMDVSMNTLLKSNLDRKLWWDRPDMQGNFETAQPFLLQAFEKSLQDFRESIEFPDVRDELETVVRALCNPDPERRGHSKNLNQKINIYGLGRFLTMLDRIAKKYQYRKQ